MLTTVSTLEMPTVKMKVCSGLAYLKDGISFSFKTRQFLDSKTVLVKLNRGNFCEVQRAFQFRIFGQRFWVAVGHSVAAVSSFSCTTRHILSERGVCFFSFLKECQKYRVVIPTLIGRVQIRTRQQSSCPAPFLQAL